MPTDTFTQLPDDAANTGDKLRGLAFTVGTDDVLARFMLLQDPTNDVQARVLTSAPTTEAGLVVRNIPSGTQPISAASLPLPTGAATETTLAALNTKIPSSPATDRTTAAAPSSVRLSDGSSFFDPRLVTIQNASIAITAAALPLATNAATDRTTAAAPFAMRISNGTAFLDPTAIRALTSADVVSAAQSGTWNITNISGTVSLPTGAATESTLSTLNGKVTACNTGAVTISAALPAGTALLGKVGIDQTTPGTTNKVSIGTDGTVAQGTAAAASAGWPIRASDGTNLVNIGDNTNSAVKTIESSCTWTANNTGAAAAATTVTQASAGTGLRNYIQGFTFGWTGAAMTATPLLQIKDGSTVIWEMYVGSVATAGVVNYEFTRALRGTAATAMTIAASAGITSQTQKITAHGYTGP